MDRTLLVKWWNDAWTEGLWAASWRRSLEGLTLAHVLWRPSPGRHSIWQIVHHMLFWREDTLARLAGKPKPTDDEIKRLNFPEPLGVTVADWKGVLDRFERSQRAIAAALADPAADISRIAYMLPHDCYHFGQINYLRALQGLPAIE
jgi:hypothetical protein